MSSVSAEELQNDFFVMLNKGDDLRSYFFLNILPSVFKNPILNSIDDDEFEKEKPVTKDDYFPESVSTSEDNASEDFCCKSKLLRDSISTVNNNNLLCSSECLRSNGMFKTTHVDIVREKLETEKIVEDISMCKENIRFPSDKRSPFLSDRICRWADCVDHISSSAKLVEHLQVYTNEKASGNLRSFSIEDFFFFRPNTLTLKPSAKHLSACGMAAKCSAVRLVPVLG